MSKKLFIDEEILLTEVDQEESKKYLEEVEKIENLKTQLFKKKGNADVEITRLQEELAKLDKEYLFETDPSKIKELADKKKDIRYEIEEYESIKNTKYNAMIKSMLKEVDEYREKAEEEKSRYEHILNEKEKQLEQELEDFKTATYDKIDELNNLRRRHSYNIAAGKYLSILMDKSEW